MKVLRVLLLAVFLSLAAFGFLLFGPAQYTQSIKQNAFYKTNIEPWLMKLISLAGIQEDFVASLLKSTGEISYRPETELLYQPANQGQKFSRRTLVSSGAASNAFIRLLDDSQITLDENSVVLIDLKKDESGKSSSLTLKVMQGAVVAQKAKTSKMAVKIVTARGQEREVTEEKLQIVAPRKIQREGLGAVQTEEYIGAVQDAKVLAQELEAKKLAELEAEAKAKAEEVQREIASVEAAKVLAAQEKLKELEDRIPQALPARKPAGLSDGRWKAPPEENHLTRAIYAQKIGRKQEAGRYIALAASNPGFFGKEFNAATRSAADSLMSSYVSSGQCQLAKDTLTNIYRKYPRSPAALGWARNWKTKAKRASCP